VLDDIVTPAIEFSSSTGHARVITALDMMHSLALELVTCHVPSGSKYQVDYPTVFTEERVEYLLACLGGNFSDIRAKALEMQVDCLPIETRER
jgi:hypothetical protein